MKRTVASFWGTLNSLGARGRRPGARPGWRRPAAPVLEELEDRSCPSITFRFDYSLDTTGFFSVPQHRAILEEAGQLLGARLSDQLSAIDPSGGNVWSAGVTDPSSGASLALDDLTVPADTILVFAGGRNYGGASVGEGGYGSYSASGSPDWLADVGSRGQVGALLPTPTGFGPWGGSVSFDTTTNWSFGDRSSGPGANQYDFLSVALHELGHMLGIGTAPSWSDQVAGGHFDGPAATAVYGSAPATDARGHHWAQGTQSGGQEADMTPSIAAGQRKLFTPLDFAALQDIGWQMGDGPAQDQVAGAQVAGAQVAAGIGVFDPTTGTWYFRNPTDPAGASFSFGAPGWLPVVGDWDGNGTQTVGVFDPNTATFYLRNSNSPGAPDVVIQFGMPGWVPVVGDWDGAGHTGIGVFDPTTATWYLRGSAAPGMPDRVFQYGQPGFVPVTGDWTGGGHTGIGVFDPATATWYLRNSAGQGAPDIGPFQYGAAGWKPVTGDWDGDGVTTVGVIDPGTTTWYVRNSNSPGGPDEAPFQYGGLGWKPVVVGRQSVNGGSARAADTPRGMTPDATAQAALALAADPAQGLPGLGWLLTGGTISGNKNGYHPPGCPCCSGCRQAQPPPTAGTTDPNTVALGRSSPTTPAASGPHV